MPTTTEPCYIGINMYTHTPELIYHYPCGYGIRLVREQLPSMDLDASRESAPVWAVTLLNLRPCSGETYLTKYTIRYVLPETIEVIRGSLEVLKPNLEAIPCEVARYIGIKARLEY